MKKLAFWLLFLAIVLTVGLVALCRVLFLETEQAGGLFLFKTLLAMASGAAWASAACAACSGWCQRTRSCSTVSPNDGEAREGNDPEYGMGHPYFWKFAMNSIPDYFYAKDLQGRYLGQNKSMLDLYDHPAESSVIGKTNAELYPNMDKEKIARLEEVDLHAAHSSYPLLAEEQVPSKHGEIMFCESVKCSYRSPDGSILGMICVSRDITSRKQIEMALLQSQAEAEAANKAKSAFLANTSHEIRTPLNGVIGMLYLVEQTGLTEKQLDYVHKATDSAKHLLGVVNDILDFSKIEAGKMTLESIPFVLVDALTQVVELYGLPARQKGVEVILTHDAALPVHVMGDPMRLRQIVTNLVGNAIKFTHEGSIHLTCDCVEQTAQSVRLRIAVRDTGIGIAEEPLRNLFKAFSQGDASRTRLYGGTGLGLAISKELVQLMGGEITVNSREGEGSTFSFTVVLGLAEQAPACTRPQNVPEQSRDKLLGKRVLLVEDNAINRLIASEMLGDVGMLVDEAQNGLEALEKIHSEGYDVVLMDIQMPLMDGLTATRTLREESAYDELPIIAMTAHAMRANFEESLAAGMQEHVTKPIDPQVLYETLLRWVK